MDMCRLIASIYDHVTPVTLVASIPLLVGRRYRNRHFVGATSLVPLTTMGRKKAEL